MKRSASAVMTLILALFANSILAVLANPTIQVDTTEEDKLLKDALKYIDENRRLQAQMVLTDESKQPVVGAHVTYAQITHDFIFGTDAVFPDAPGSALRQNLGTDWGQLPLLYWAQIEPRRGVFNFERVDRAMSVLYRTGQRQFYAMLPIYPKQTPVRDPPVWTNWQMLGKNETHFKEYLSYVYEFVHDSVKHFGNRVKVWSTDPEFNIRLLVPDRIKDLQIPLTLTQLLELTRVQAQAIRDAKPDAWILLGASGPMKTWAKDYSPDVDPIDFAKMAISYGVDFDGVYIEAQPWQATPAAFYEYLLEFLAIHKPAFLGEAKYYAGPPAQCQAGTPTSPGWKQYDEDTQALWAKYMVIYTFALGSGFVWWPFFDWFDPTDRACGSFIYGGLVDVNGTARKSYFVYKDLIRQFTSSGTGQSDAKGQITFDGFAGDYTILVDGYPGYSIHLAEGQQNRFVVNLSPLEGPKSQTTLSNLGPLQTDWTLIMSLATTALLIVAIVSYFILSKRVKTRRQSH